MHPKQLLMATVGMCMLAGTAFAQQAETPLRVGGIIANQTGDRTYHHITLDLGTADLVQPPGLMDRDLAYTLADGGQFEIYVRPDVLPIDAPGCENGIIVRMPWTNPDLPDAGDAVADKAVLLAAFEALRDGQSESVRTTLELAPYLALNASGQPQMLTQCNVFFRHAAGHYIDHNGPLTDD